MRTYFACRLTNLTSISTDHLLVTMAAVLRVKRRNDDEPLEALVIACKRRKTVNPDGQETSKSGTDAEEESSPVTAVLKFAGTIKNQADNVVEHLTKNLTKEELKSNFKQHVVNVTTKAREQTKQESQASRYRVVNCFRSLEPNDHQELKDKEMTVIDVEENPTEKSDAATTEDSGYVYDLYYTQTGDDMLIDNLVSVHPLQQDLVFGSYRENGLDSDGDFESEDSNSESNWRNDYPDSDHSENSICDEDMRNAVMRMNCAGEDSDLSSDEYDQDLVYSLAEHDVDNFGYKYAKYKAKIKAEMADDISVESEKSSDDEDDEDRQYEDP